MTRPVTQPGSPPAALWILLLAALPGYLLLWPDAPIIQGDSLQYQAVARDLADFRLERLHDRAPGYPILMVLTGSAQAPARTLFVASLLLHLGSIWLLAGTLRAARVNRRWLLVFAGILLLPSSVEPAAHVMTETLAQFTLVLGVAALASWSTNGRPAALLGSAAAFAFAGLTRPVYQLLGPAIALAVLLAPGALRGLRITGVERLKAACALVLATALIVGGFAAVNHFRFGYFGISPLAGFHLTTKTILLMDRVPDEYAVVREILIRQRDHELVRRGGTHTGSQTIWEARGELETATGLSTPELSAHLLRMNLALVRKAPLEYLQEVARAMATYWFPAAGPLAGAGSAGIRWLGTAVHFLLVGSFLGQLVVLAGLIVFTWSARLAGVPREFTVFREVTPLQRTAWLLATGVVLYTFVLTCVLDVGEPRQRRATDALIVFVCFLGAHVWIRTVRSLPFGGIR